MQVMGDPKTKLRVSTCHGTSYATPLTNAFVHRCGIVVNAIFGHWWGMGREDQHFRLRLPADLRALVEDAAQQNRRSMTAEILARLQASFEWLPAATAPHSSDYVTRGDLAAAVEQATQDGIYTAIAKIARAAEHQSQEIGREGAKEKIFQIFESTNDSLKALDDGRVFARKLNSDRADNLENNKKNT